MSRANEASFVRGPRVGHVYKYAATTTHAVFKTPTEWLGSKVTIASEDCKIHISFGSASTIEVASDAVSTRHSTTLVLTVNTTSGGYVPQDQLRDFDVEKTSTYFAVESDQSGYWIGQVSSKF